MVGGRSDGYANDLVTNWLGWCDHQTMRSAGLQSFCLIFGSKSLLKI